jgi:hypothetical protein
MFLENAPIHLNASMQYQTTSDAAPIKESGLMPMHVPFSFSCHPKSGHQIACCSMLALILDGILRRPHISRPLCTEKGTLCCTTRVSSSPKVTVTGSGYIHLLEHMLCHKSQAFTYCRQRLLESRIQLPLPSLATLAGLHRSLVQ